MDASASGSKFSSRPAPARKWGSRVSTSKMLEYLRKERSDLRFAPSRSEAVRVILRGVLRFGIPEGGLWLCHYDDMEMAFSVVSRPSVRVRPWEENPIKVLNQEWYVYTSDPSDWHPANWIESGVHFGIPVYMEDRRHPDTYAWPLLEDCVASDGVPALTHREHSKLNSFAADVAFVKLGQTGAFVPEIANIIGRMAGCETFFDNSRCHLRPDHFHTTAPLPDVMRSMENYPVPLDKLNLELLDFERMGGVKAYTPIPRGHPGQYFATVPADEDCDLTCYQLIGDRFSVHVRGGTMRIDGGRAFRVEMDCLRTRRYFCEVLEYGHLRAVELPIIELELGDVVSAEDALYHSSHWLSYDSATKKVYCRQSIALASSGSLLRHARAGRLFPASEGMGGLILHRDTISE